jgi:nucleotide-binding universal stress UspA family protein
MTLIAGYAPDAHGAGVLHLGALLTRSAGDDLVVCSVVPAPWVPGMARVDAEYRAFLDQAADDALERARQQLPDGVTAELVRHRAQSVSSGLVEVATERGASMLLLGSSSAGHFGHVALGSVSDPLLHSSPVTLMLAPRGFRIGPQARVTRVTAAYGGTTASEELVVAAAGVAARVGASLRIASFAVWSRPSYTMRLGTDTEDAVFEEWTTQIRESATDALAQVEGLAVPPPSVETAVGRGSSWGEAVDDLPWHEGDVLVVGSSEPGGLAQVFLGSRAAKIVRHSPVPVAVVPRARAAALADRAAHG